MFGCVDYAHTPDSEGRKLDKKAEKSRFVGYCKNSKGYRLLDHTDEKTRKILKRRDVTFILTLAADLGAKLVKDDGISKDIDQVKYQSVVVKSAIHCHGHAL